MTITLNVTTTPITVLTTPATTAYTGAQIRDLGQMLGRDRVAKTAAYTITAADRGRTIDCTSGTYTVSITAAATLGSGFHVGVINSGSGVITLDGNGAEPIRGPSGSAATLVLAKGQSAILVCDGAGWQVIANSGLRSSVLPTSTTALAVAKFSDTVGTIVNSGVTIDASNNMAGVALLTTSGKLRINGATGLVASLAFEAVVTNPGGFEMIDGLGTSRRRLNMTVDSAGAVIDSFQYTVGAIPLALNPNGGRILIAGPTDDGTTAVQINGAAKASGAVVSTSPTAGIGYGTGAGSTVAQITSKSTGVTLNTVCGAITLNAASLAASTGVGFTLTNSAIAASDGVHVNIKSGATADSYTVTVDACAAGSCRISLRNLSAGALAEAVVLTFVIIKAVIA